MPGLALETSGKIGSIALLSDAGDLLAEETFPHGLHHATSIVPMLQTLCVVQKLSPLDLTRIYVSVGPGSFTGLRLAVTLAKTMAMVTAQLFFNASASAAVAMAPVGCGMPRGNKRR